MTAHVSHQMRCWSADIFLKRNKVIDLRFPLSVFVTLKAAALHYSACLGMLLDAVQNIGRVIHLECELFDLVEYHMQFKVVFSSLMHFESVEIHFSCLDQTLLEDVRVPRALMSALACAKRVRQLDITPSWTTSPPRQLGPSIVTASQSTVRAVRRLMKTMEKVSLSFHFMNTKLLRRACRVLMKSPSVYDFSLDDVTHHGLEATLPFIRLPSLVVLQLRSGNDRLHLPSHFFERHTNLTHLTIFSLQEDTPPLDALPVQVFPTLCDLSLSSNYYNWMLDSGGPTTLRIQPHHIFPSLISSDAFCIAVKSLSRPLRMVIANNYEQKLVIRLPNGIEEHIFSQPSGMACCGCGDESISGLRAVELETENLHSSTLVSAIFSVALIGGLTRHDQQFLLLWIKILPSLTHLKVDSQTRPLCTTADLNSFLTSSLQCCPDLVTFKCPKVGTWRRRSGAREWYHI